MRVLTVNDLGFGDKGGSLYMAYQQQKETLAQLTRPAPSARSASEAFHERPPRIDPVQAMLAQTRSATTLFAATSRYYGIDTATLERADGTQIVYLRRRFLPPPTRFQPLQEHTVMQGERLDNIAAQLSRRPDAVLAAVRREPRHAARRADRDRRTAAPHHAARRRHRERAMNQGFYLTLMMGSFNASPVPQPVIDALTDVQVTSTVGSQARLPAEVHARQEFAASQQLLQSGFFDPRTRVIIAVTVNGTTEVLMDGIITKQDVTPSNDAGKSHAHRDRSRPDRADGLHRSHRHPVSGAADVRDRRDDPREVRRARHRAARDPADPRR